MRHLMIFPLEMQNGAIYGSLYLFTLDIALEFPTVVTLYLMYATVLGPYYSTWLVQCQIKEPSIFVVFWQ